MDIKFKKYSSKLGFCEEFEHVVEYYYLWRCTYEG